VFKHTEFNLILSGKDSENFGFVIKSNSTGYLEVYFYAAGIWPQATG
jgi:hypothetical protein